MRLLVTGGRTYGMMPDPPPPIDSKLYRIALERSIRQRSEVHLRLDSILHRDIGDDDTLVIIQGGARGADTIARLWAGENEVTCITYAAEWKKYGRAAGAIRNQLMLDDGKPDRVLAFPGGRGTANMIRLAQKAGLPIEIVPDD